MSKERSCRELKFLYADYVIYFSFYAYGWVKRRASVLITFSSSKLSETFFRRLLGVVTCGNTEKIGGCAENTGPENGGLENGGPINPECQKVENAGLENGGPENAGPTTCAENAAIMSVISERNVLINMTVDSVMRCRCHSHYVLLLCSICDMSCLICGLL